MRKSKKIQTFLRAVRVAKAVSTLAVIAVPVATTVGMITGYGVYFLLRSMRRAK